MFSENEIISTDGFLSAFPSNYHKTDTVKFRSPIRWRDGVGYPPVIGQQLIVTGHSDYDIVNSDVEYYRPKVWWCVNKQTKLPNVFSIPLGIINFDYKYIPIHIERGNKALFVELINSPPVLDKKLVYMNFDVSTYPSERTAVREMFKDKHYVTVENNTGIRQYLTSLKSHTFALCPRGNGVDTHRMWEAMYMGCIPIVRRDVAMEDFYDLPICFIDSWDEVNEEFLEEAKKRIVFDMEKLKMSYWVNKIKASIV